MSTTFHVGDRVRVPLGRRMVIGTIAEDRGSIGVQGRHIFHVLVPADPFEPAAFDFAESDIESLPDSAELEPPIDPAQVVGYLKNGGLVSILQANLAGGRNQPSVWLCHDTLGNMTHTFDKKRGRVGGETVPFLAVEGQRVFQPKVEEVLALIKSFGLDHAAAAAVIQSVGVFPR